MVKINIFIYKVLINLRNAVKGFKSFTDSFYNLLLLYILDLFYKRGYIQGYKYLTKYRIRIFFKYTNTYNVLKGLRFNKKNNFSLKKLYYLFYSSLYKPYYIYFFSTPVGFYTLDELMFTQKVTGGLLYFYIKIG